MLSISDQSLAQSELESGLSTAAILRMVISRFTLCPSGRTWKKGWNFEKIVISWVLYGFVLNKW